MYSNIFCRRSREKLNDERKQLDLKQPGRIDVFINQKGQALGGLKESSSACRITA
mgnify:CR=1 FL=1